MGPDLGEEENSKMATECFLTVSLRHKRGHSNGLWHVRLAAYRWGHTVGWCQSGWGTSCNQEALWFALLLEALMGMLGFRPQRCLVISLTTSLLPAVKEKN
jgi:hypothetical protein